LNNMDEISEAIEKLNNLANGILKLKEFIQDTYQTKAE